MLVKRFEIISIIVYSKSHWLSSIFLRETLVGNVVFAVSLIVLNDCLVCIDVNEKINHYELIWLLDFSHESPYFIYFLILYSVDVIFQAFPASSDSYHTNCTFDHKHFKISSDQIFAWCDSDNWKLTFKIKHNLLDYFIDSITFDCLVDLLEHLFGLHLRWKLDSLWLFEQGWRLGVSILIFLFHNRQLDYLWFPTHLLWLRHFQKEWLLCLFFNHWGFIFHRGLLNGWFFNHGLFLNELLNFNDRHMLNYLFFLFLNRWFYFFYSWTLYYWLLFNDRFLFNNWFRVRLLDRLRLRWWLLLYRLWLFLLLSRRRLWRHRKCNLDFTEVLDLSSIIHLLGFLSVLCTASSSHYESM